MNTQIVPSFFEVLIKIQLKKVLLFIGVVHLSFCFSQHSNKFLEFTNNITPSDSSLVKTDFSDGRIKQTGLYYYFQQPEYRYRKKTGEWIAYYKNGNIKTIERYDRLGNLLYKELYDLVGHISSILNASAIDIRGEFSNNYFVENYKVVTTYKVKNYRINKRTGEPYLREIGKTKGPKRIGVWKIYTESGAIEREINYAN